MGKLYLYLLCSRSGACCCWIGLDWTACICAVNVGCPTSVRPSVCPVVRQRQRRAAGLLLSAVQHGAAAAVPCASVASYKYYIHTYIHTFIQVWLGSRVVSVLDSGAEGPGFKSQPRRCRVTALGKLFTPIVPTFIKQQKLAAVLLRVAGVTSGLAESNGSLPPGL